MLCPSSAPLPPLFPPLPPIWAALASQGLSEPWGLHLTESPRVAVNVLAERACTAPCTADLHSQPCPWHLGETKPFGELPFQLHSLPSLHFPLRLCSVFCTAGNSVRRTNSFVTQHSDESYASWLSAHSSVTSLATARCWLALCVHTWLEAAQAFYPGPVHAAGPRWMLLPGERCAWAGVGVGGGWEVGP